MKRLAIKLGLGLPAGITASKIIFGLGQDYCSKGVISSFGTGVLAVMSCLYVYANIGGFIDAVLNPDEEEETENG